MDIKEILVTEKSRLNFLKGLIRLSKIDGNISEEEKKFFVSAAIQMEMTQNAVNLLDTYWENDSKEELYFESSKEALLFLREAIQLCAIDNVYDNREKNEIREIAKELNIKESHVVTIEDWVSEGMKWQALGEKLIYLE